MSGTGSARARLTALRLVGFKSFAERTVVEFGPGISAVVGPNGSGKSNLADALRWTLGEAGRSLRTRRAEDVIFAGSSSRRAISMADVTLVIDNRDRLLPVDYGEVELGRRLYRSGENEYLLNRQRVRLRDLLELLDAGNLADNAFLFIGQGMVDQALALRPEERRPLFEEAAGVRRHERRRRQAEAELMEAESNLERLRDLLGELRPQSRRLAAQAEQLQARRTAGLELAEALVAAARARWMDSSRAAASEQAALDAAHAQADAALSDLRASEELAEQLSRALGERAELERRQRDELEQLRAATLELRLRQAREASEVEGIERDRARLAHERAAIEQRAADARRSLARLLPEADQALERELADTDRRLAALDSGARDDAASAVGGPVAGAGQSAMPGQAAIDALRTDLAEQKRRSDVIGDRLGQARTKAAAAEPKLARALEERDGAVAVVGAAAEAEAAAERAAEAARSALETAIARQADSARALAEAEARLGAAKGRAAALDAAMATMDGGLQRAARARGGALAAEGLEVEPRFRRAVAAALGEAGHAVAVDEGAAVALRAERGVLLLSDASSSGSVAGEGTREGRRASAGRPSEANAVESAAAAAEGGLLGAAIRRDPLGHVTRLLARVAWAPDLQRALAVRRALPPGWSVVTPAGELVREDGIVRLSGGESILDQRSRADDLARELREMEADLATARSESARASAERTRAAAALEHVRRELDDRRRVHRVAAEAERPAQRRAEGLLREREWEQSQLERLESEAAAAEARVAEVEAQLALLSAAQPRVSATEVAPPTSGVAAAQQVLDELRTRRDRLATARDAAAAQRQAAGEERRTAEITLALDDARAEQLDSEAQRLAGREAELAALRERSGIDLASAEDRESRARAVLDAALRAGTDERSRLQQAERAALEAREKLRTAETRSRTAEVAAMEARLHLEQVREQLLVELAGIGPDGLAALRQEHEAEAATDDDLSADVLGARLEQALDTAVQRWDEQPEADALPPTTGPVAVPPTARLAVLRRRFHEVGAGNPFATQEYAAVHDRLEALEAQRADLETAIRTSRELIGNLTNLITDQFLTTFAALEGAFARRFRQLFDGGEAQLSLTEPEDLSATGVEITARPPGKKRQPLAMLSGGERALTAVALLLAMLEVRPVPFCVLDEVDAALDEANIHRFAAALRGLADQIQFIVITHNRGTIEAADALYGVTVGEDSVSHVVSLRLPDANGHGELPADLLSAVASADG